LVEGSRFWSRVANKNIERGELGPNPIKHPLDMKGIEDVKRFSVCQPNFCLCGDPSPFTGCVRDIIP
jgi:hypothetical protein